MVDSCRVCENRGTTCKAIAVGNSQTYNGLEQDKKTPTYGGYSKTIVVNEDFVLHISAIGPRGNSSVAVRGDHHLFAVKTLESRKGCHKLAVLGLGGLGHMGVKFAMLGAEVTVLSTSPSKEQDAKQLGAHHFLATRDEAGGGGSE